MSHKSRLRAAESRRMSFQMELALREKFGEDAGKPASQRETDPYPSPAPLLPRYTRDRWGITLAFRTNRKERRKSRHER